MHLEKVTRKPKCTLEKKEHEHRRQHKGYWSYVTRGIRGGCTCLRLAGVGGKNGLVRWEASRHKLLLSELLDGTVAVEVLEYHEQQRRPPASVGSDTLKNAILKTASQSSRMPPEQTLTETRAKQLGLDKGRSHRNARLQGGGCWRRGGSSAHRFGDGTVNEVKDSKSKDRDNRIEGSGGFEIKGRDNRIEGGRGSKLKDGDNRIEEGGKVSK
ncbi:hypothetical protein BKA70DRAFT_1241759 [Coprinopsis sp. MPI-PUGE-AT-0042]|nr:hypothetical protein BKA70DRAFT_1241759 [Coprinopsis sp. MPI-PUGE-AT-0042]